MAYDRFDELVTSRYNVVVKNWPLKKFCNPSAVTSRIELELLYNAWQSGATYFQKLTREEMEVWENDRFSSRMELMSPPAELVPTLALPQAPTRMTLSPEPPRQDHSDFTPPSPHDPQSIPLTPVTNLVSRPVPTTTTSHPPAPDPDTIAMMIRADPALQNVDPTLIAMGIAGRNQHQATTTTTIPPIELLSNPVLHTSGSKRRWQEVVTPLSFNGQVAKKPRKQRKAKHPQPPLASQRSEN